MILIDKLVNYDYTRIVNLRGVILKASTSINYHFIPDLYLFRELVELHLFDLQLNLRLLFLTLKLQVLNEYYVFFEYVSEKLASNLPVANLTPFTLELLSPLLQRYHLSLVII